MAGVSILFGGTYIGLNVVQPPSPPKNIIIDDPGNNRTFIRSIEFRETIDPGTRYEKNYTMRYSEYRDENGNIFLELDKGGKNDKM